MTDNGMALWRGRSAAPALVDLHARYGGTEAVQLISHTQKGEPCPTATNSTPPSSMGWTVLRG
jgi:hypothetical protein